MLHLECNDVLLASGGTCDFDGVIHSLAATVAEEEAGELVGANLHQAVDQTELCGGACWCACRATYASIPVVGLQQKYFGQRE